MATNETVVEIIRFTEKGVDEISARTKVMAQQIDEASKRMKILSGLMNDPAYARREQQLNSINKSYELMALRMRNVSAAQGLADGSAAKHAKSVGALNKQHELTGLKLRNVVAQQGLADGSTAKHIRSVAGLNREHEKTRRILEYSAKYGDRIGRFVERYGGTLGTLGGLAGGAAAMGIGLARRGFQGTTHQATFDNETQMLSRQFASVMLPVMEVMTRGARAIRERMEKLSGGGQDLMMGGLLAGGTGAGIAAMSAGSRMMGLIAGETMAANLRSGMIRGGVSMAGGAALGYGLLAGNVTSGALGGAALGFSVGGLPGAAIGGVAGGLATQASLSPKSRPGEYGSRYYRRMRDEEGMSTFGAGIASMGEASSSAWKWATSSANSPRRDVQVSGGGYDAPGTAFDRVNAAVAKVESEGGGGSSPADATRENTSALKTLSEKLVALRTGYEAAVGSSGGSVLTRLARPGAEP